MTRSRERATVTLELPAPARIHLPTAWNVGTLLDRDMPLGETFVAGLNYFGTPWLTYPFVLVDLGAEGWLEVAARHELEAIGPGLGGGGLLEHITPLRPSATVTRTAGGFTLAFEHEASHAATQRTWPSMEAAVEHHHAWLRATYGLRPLRERVSAGDLPAWVTGVPAVFTFDLWRPNGEVAHTYVHLRDLARDLQALGVPPGMVFYLPGWCAPYDRGYPDYRPAPELGGRAAFAEALAALHEAGFRAMVHTLAWGADPYSSGFDRLAHLAVRAEPHHPRTRLCGPYVGWPGGAPARALDWDVRREPLHNARPGPRGWLFETAPLPEPCEALFTLGGLSGLGDAVVKVTVSGRGLSTPAGWFRGQDTYRFPFPLRFVAGANTVELEAFGAPGARGTPRGAPLDLDGARYSLTEVVQFTGAWTAPIAGMDSDSPAWHAAYLERLAPTVGEFGIDAVHVDASFLWRWDDAGFFAALRRRLPRTVFGTEGVTAAGMRLFTLGQGGRLPAESPRGAWASKPSDLPWRLAGEYMRIYQHLCGPHGFVPVGSSCNVCAVPSALPEGEAERWGAQLARSPEAHVLYTLRVNYRDYGLDEATRRFLLEHVVPR